MTRGKRMAGSGEKKACVCFAITLFALCPCIGCGRASRQGDVSETIASMGNPDSGAEHATSHQRMKHRLDAIGQQSATDHLYLGSSEAEQLRQMVDGSATPLPTPVRWMTTFRLAQKELVLGHEQEAIRRYLQCRDFIHDAVIPSKRVDAEIRLMFELGVAYMRWGETQNCCLRNDPESCILPIRGNGVHARPDGSRSAIQCFMHVLKITDPDDEWHLKSRWLLNLAWMTLGEHPDGVPAEYLIPSEAFQSQESFPHFRNVSQSLGLDTFSTSGGVIIDDFDNDDYLDLITSPWDPRDQIRLFRNARNGTFREYTKSSGLNGFCGGLNLVQADYDNDGDLDFLVLRGAWLAQRGSHPNSLMRNNGDGTFTDVTLDVGMTTHLPTQTAAWADYDNDGDLDLFIGNEGGIGINAPCQLYQNNGTGGFRDVAASAGVENHRFTKGVTWGDIDGDRYPDLFVSNQGQKNRLYRNNRDGTFKDIATEAGVELPLESFPAWFWDYNNDGHLDLYVAVYSANTADLAKFYLGKPSDAERARLFLGDGAGAFVDVAKNSGLDRPDASMGANFGDLDNDGYLDFYLGTGYPSYESLMPGVMYRNERGKRFVDVTTAGGFGHLQKGHAVAFADLDHDGDQDVFEQMGGAFAGDRFHDALYENPGMGNHWLTLHLVGTTSNRSAIGAVIRIDITEAGQSRTVYRRVNSGGSFGSNPLRQTIGLGAATRIDRLQIYWPTSDTEQSFSAVPMDGHFRITEGQDQLHPLDVHTVTLGGSNTTADEPAQP